MKERLGSLLLLLGSILFGLLLAEVGTRYLLPLSPGARTLDLEGKPVAVDGDRLRFPRNLQYREVAQEFDVLITVTEKGHRVPAVDGSPEMIFLGDSMTFGMGLTDEQTFVAQFCDGAHLRCANLGRGGTGTRWQLDILEEFLESEGWRPKELRLFMMVMTSALMAGNDLTDNLHDVREAGDKCKHEPRSWLAKVLAYRKLLLRYSNLARVTYFYFGPYLRSALSPAPEGNELDAALRATVEQLNRLEEFSQHYGFRYKVYLLYPMQDLLRGSHQKTLETIIPIVPNGQVVDTSSAVLDDPSRYFYPYDGHLNAEGAKRIAEFLLREHRAAETIKPN